MTETEGFLGALTYTAYPVGTAVYTEYPCEKDLKPWENPDIPKQKLDREKLPVTMEGNLYFNNALPYHKEKNAAVEKESGITFKIDYENKKVEFHTIKPALFSNGKCRIISTEILGHGLQAEMLFENPDETPFIFDTDFFGRQRSKNPTPGPFEVKNIEAIEISFA